MKETGIVRKIDELGRIVIPIEIRRNMKVKSGDEMEMFISPDGDIVVRKHSKIKNLYDTLSEFVGALKKFEISHAFVTNMSNVVCYAGNFEPDDMQGSFLSKTLERKLADRRSLILQGDECIKVTVNDEIIYRSQIVCSILCAGDLYGGIVFGSQNRIFTKTELALAEYLSEILALKI